MKTAAWLVELNARFDRPLVCRCAHCEFKVRARLEEARVAFEQHDCGRPGAGSVRKRKAEG